MHRMFVYGRCCHDCRSTDVLTMNSDDLIRARIDSCNKSTHAGFSGTISLYLGVAWWKYTRSKYPNTNLIGKHLDFGLFGHKFCGIVRAVRYGHELLLENIYALKVVKEG